MSKQYSSIITLAKISDGKDGASGYGIKKVEVFYAISDSGLQPPSDNIVEYAIQNEALTSSDPVNTFRITAEGYLYLIREEDFKVGIDKINRNDILSIDTEYWKEYINEVEAGKFLWTKTITTYTNEEVVITYSVNRIGADGQDGAEGPQGPAGPAGTSLEVKYINSESIPEIKNNDVSGWSNTIPIPEPGKHTYMIQKLSTEIKWSAPVQISAEDGTTPTVSINEGYWVINGEQTQIKAEGQDGQDGKTPDITIGENGYWYIDGVQSNTKAQGEAGKDGKDGKDGSEIEYVYYLSNEDSAPNSPVYNNNTLSDGWTQSPQGVSEEKQYEYVSIRKKPLGGSWGAFSEPVIWSKWGEKGQDGDGVEYKYYLSNSTKKPDYSADDNKWTDDPSGVTKDEPYEYVVQIKTVNGTSSSGEAALWAKYGQDGQDGQDGNGIKSVYTQYIYSDNGENAPSPDEKWEDSIADLGEGKGYYLWTKTVIKYDNGESTESFSVNYIGQDANVYYIETNQKEILRFQNSYGVSYSPNSLRIEVYKYPRSAGERVELEKTTEGTTKRNFVLRYLAENEAEEEYIEVDSKFLNLENDKKAICFEVQAFYESFLEDPSNSPFYLGNNKINLFQIEFLDGSNSVLMLFESRLGVTADMAQFNLYANRLNASIQQTKLDFSSEGLSIMNGGIKIYKDSDFEYFVTSDVSRDPKKEYYEKNGESFYQVAFNDTEDSEEQFTEGVTYYERKEKEIVFGADDNGNLTLKGIIYATDGKFSGEIEAARGSFNGTITSTEGSIGGITISEKGISAGKFSLTKEGLIKAEDIELGQNAKIKGKLSILGKVVNDNGEETFEEKACIQSPTQDNNNTILSAGTISIKSNSTLQIGNANKKNIIIYGGEEGNLPYIQSGNPQSSAFWKINGDGTAQFNEIIADKATIKNSVLEIGTVQAAGSTMIFSDAWKVTGVENITEDGPAKTRVHIEGSLLASSSTDTNGDTTNTYFLSALDRVLVNNSTILKVVACEEDYFDVIEEVSLSSGDIVAKIGPEGSYILSATGNSNAANDYASKHSISLTRFGVSDGNAVFTKELILGDLAPIGRADVSGTGLYAENVYLTGSLTTNVGGSYAGINTKSNISFGKSEEENKDETPIVIWAGADGTDAESIQNAKFQVSQNGTLYAQNGVFEDSVFVGGTIQAAKIKTAEIYGIDPNNAKDNVGDLTLYDAKAGIVFKSSSDTETGPEIVLKISNNGMFAGNSDTAFLALTGNTASANLSGLTIKDNESTESTEGITFSSTGISSPNDYTISANSKTLTIGETIETNTNFKVNGKTIAEELEVSNNVKFGNNFSYNKVAGGYNLFIT